MSNQASLPERIKAYWTIGHDTASIAQICRVKESEVYNLLDSSRDVEPCLRGVSTETPKYLIPYAGRGF